MPTKVFVDPPGTLLAQCCGNCYFRRLAQCRFQIIGTSEGPENDAIFPKVSPYGWCGNYRLMPVEQATSPDAPGSWLRASASNA